MVRDYEHLVMAMAGDAASIDLPSVRYHLALMSEAPLLVPAKRSGDDAELLRQVHGLRSVGGPWASLNDTISSRFILGLEA